jgi:hypothetical protein
MGCHFDMKESKLLGSLLPTHPDFAPIIQEIREKYQLPEISPDDDPICEIYLEDQIVPLPDFLEEIHALLQEKTDLLPPQYARIYKQGKKNLGKPFDMRGYEKLLPADMKKAFSGFYRIVQSTIETVVNILDGQYKKIAEMLYIYILTGETEETPNDWISKVVRIEISGEPVILAFASQVANPDVVIQQFRSQYKKTFGAHRPKVTKTVVSTAYYMRLKRLGKPWKYIVEEFIRLNNFSLPRDRSSNRYSEVWHRYEQVLKKRIQRSEKVVSLLLRDIK